MINGDLLVFLAIVTFCFFFDATCINSFSYLLFDVQFTGGVSEISERILRV